MDRKSIVALVICFILLVLWYPLVVNKLYPPKPLPAGATNAAPSMVTGTNAAPAPGMQAEAPVANVFKGVSSTNEEEHLLEITNDNARYTFTSHGGGLKQIELVHYPESVSTRAERLSTNRVATLNSFTPVPTLAVLGGDAVEGDGVFELKQTTNGVRAEKQLTNGLTIVKEFELSSNYLVFAKVRLENRSERPLPLPSQEWVVGTATPMNAQDPGTAVGMLWYNGAKGQDIVGYSFFSTRGFACMPRTPPAEYRGGQSNVVWAAVHNQFFALVLIPHESAEHAVMRKIELPRPSIEEAELDSRIVREPAGYVATMIYPGQSLTPKQTVERTFAIYAGPKEYRTLATISSALNHDLDPVMGFGFWGFFSKALLLGMNWLHSVLRMSYGWAIITITVVIKVVFWPLTQASTRSMKRLQALQPQLKAIQEKYKDDPVKAQQKQMEFYKQNKINPMGGCLPTLIQMPVFFGFFFMIRTAIELRGASWLWVHDLSRPDTLFLIPGLNFPFNLLPLVMGATMLWQSHLTPPSPGMDPAQAKLMRYMPLMFLVFLYNYSAGLTLYWTVQNLLSVLQTRLIKNMPAPTLKAAVPVATAPRKKR